MTHTAVDYAKDRIRRINRLLRADCALKGRRPDVIVHLGEAFRQRLIIERKRWTAFLRTEAAYFSSQHWE